jgi:hypothetical protein
VAVVASVVAKDVCVVAALCTASAVPGSVRLLVPSNTSAWHSRLLPPSLKHATAFVAERLETDRAVAAPPEVTSRALPGAVTVVPLITKALHCPAVADDPALQHTMALLLLKAATETADGAAVVKKSTDVPVDSAVDKPPY